jgi:hypothetical protein
MSSKKADRLETWFNVEVHTMIQYLREVVILVKIHRKLVEMLGVGVVPGKKAANLCSAFDTGKREADKQ